MLTLELLLCILLLAFLCERVHVAVQFLTSIASSSADINIQLMAFIEGASHDPDLEFEDMELSFLSRYKVQWWSMLGRRNYQTHGSWFHEQREAEDKQAKGDL